jgi:hypothetical protein
MNEPTLQTLGRYTIHAELGRGGFATVYRATDTVLERDVALKVLKPGWTDDAKAVERFMREAKQASRLKHANIVTIFDVGQAEGRLFIAMELVRGRSLQQIIAEDGPMAWSRMLTIMEQSATALDYAHKQGLIHRDIKPANIILDESEPGAAVHAILTDFGLVRGAEQASLSMGSTGGLLGTPEYIAPEIWDGEPATKATDIYALGCVAYFLLTGQILFGATTPVAVLKRHVEGPVFPQQWPSGVPAGADAVLRRALAKDPTQRHASASQLAVDLQACEGQAAKEQAAQAQEAKRQEEAARAAQVALAAETARRAEEERARQEAERKAKEEADRTLREEQERRRQAELAAQTAAVAKAKQEADERERQRQAREAARLAEEEARRKQIEQQPPAAPVGEVFADKNIKREAVVIDRKRFWWLSVAGGIIGWGLGWLIFAGAVTGSSYGSNMIILIFIIAGLCAGIIPSLAQWLGLRQVASVWKWILASVVGLGVGGGLGFFIIVSIVNSTRYMSPFVGMAMIGGLAGLGMGLGQWLVLRRQMSNVLWWLAANAGALGLGLAVAFSTTISWPSNEILGIVIVLTLGCALQSVVTGWLLPRCLRPLGK